MNDRTLSIGTAVEVQLIEDALAALSESTGIEGKLLLQVTRAEPGVKLQVAGKSLQYNCAVKQTIDRFLTLHDLKARSVLNATTILVCRPLTAAMAERCQMLDIQFIDTAGNAYITDREGVLISVTGRKPGRTLLQAPDDSTITPAALRMIFGFLAEPAMLNAPYREIAPAVQVSTGAIAKAFDALEKRGFIGTTPSGSRLIRSPELLLGEWSAGFLQRLRPKLKKFRFSAANPDQLTEGWNPGFAESAWGGEVAAALITQHLNPQTFTIYMDMQANDVSEIVKRFRLRADPAGTIEVLQPFWNMRKFTEFFPTVPLHLIYADLLATHDSRNLKVAEQVFKKVINHVHDAQGQAT